MASSPSTGTVTRPGAPAGKPPNGLAATRTTTGLIVKIIILGVVLAIAIWGAFPLIDAKNWLGLAILIVVTLIIFFIYLTPRALPAKYLAVGTLFLIAFQVIPIVKTATTAFTNYGDGHLGSKSQAISDIASQSLTQVKGSATYTMSPALDSSGNLVLLLADASKQYYVGSASGLKPLDASAVKTSTITGKITQVSGYTVLNLGQAAARGAQITALSIPTDKGAIVAQGLSTAYEKQAAQTYDSGCDCITDSTNGKVYKANNSSGEFIASDGSKLAQGWQANVGFSNFWKALTDPTIRGPFLKIILWNFAFAILVVSITFAAGLAVAMVMNSPKLKGQKIYRSLLILPYAMPSFAMLLIWKDMFNTQYGLFNRLFGLHVDWFGTTWGARAAVLLAQLWVGYPYMFLVCTGALQSVPADLVEAASVDGAKPGKAFRTITFPLLLVATAPLLIGSFAFNFNNFGAIFLTSEGGPFPPDNPTAGSTDLLISYTYRLAFGAGGHQYGFAAAISIFIFILVAFISYLGFRRTKVLEELN